jgi:hypothetical protein
MDPLVPIFGFFHFKDQPRPSKSMAMQENLTGSFSG